MTIGPAPMIRIDWRSVLFGIHHHREALEQIADIVRPGARFRMPLKTECRPVNTRQPLQRAVKQRYMSCSERRRQRGRIDSETMVLAGDDYACGVEILDRVVRAVMAEVHLNGLRAWSEAHQL